MTAWARQCELARGRRHQVAFLPEARARVGAWLRLAGEDGWRVVTVGIRVPQAYVQAHRDDYRTAFASLQS